jgi:hypothetical protein
MVLCGASDCFKPLLDPNRHFKDSEQEVIELRDDDPEAVSTMIQYIYTGEYAVADAGDTPMAHLEVLKASKKYLIPKLPEKAVKRFRTSFTEFIDEGKDGQNILRLIETLVGSRVFTILLSIAPNNTANRTVLVLRKARQTRFVF